MNQPEEIKQLIARELPRLIREDQEIRALVLSSADSIRKEEREAGGKQKRSTRTGAASPGTHSAPVLQLYSDGASRGNPGPAAIGFLLQKEGEQEPLLRQSKFLGQKTNNEAEYLALLGGLEEAAALKNESSFRLEIRMDSELVVKQIKGEYRVKNENLKPLHRKALQLLDSFPDWSIRHIPREENSEADRLANEAFENRKG